MVIVLLSALAPASAAYSCACGVREELGRADAETDGTVDSLDERTVETTSPDSAVSLCEQADTNHSIAGCEYWMFSPHRLYEFACGAVVLSNLSDVDAEIHLDFRGAVLDVRKFMRLVSGHGKTLSYLPMATPVVPPGATAVLSLFQGKDEGFSGETCPSPAAASGTIAPTGADSLGYGVHLVSTAPVAAFFEHPYGSAASDVVGATALRAVASWDTRYRDIGSFQPGRTKVQGPAWDLSGTEPTWTALVPSGQGIVSLVSNGGSVGYTLPRGNVLTLEQDDNFLGALITGTKSFGAWTSASTFIPYNWPSGDFNILQFSPVVDWGTEYAAVSHPPRFEPNEEPAIWRVLADSDATVFTYDPAAPAGAPTMLNAGKQSIFFARAPFVVRSQDASHRFYVSQLMTSASYGDRGDPFMDAASLQETDAGRGYGDPEIENTPPPAEYAKHYAFFTDVTFPTTYLVVIRKKDSLGFHAVSLDCAGELAGWLPIGASDYEYVYAPLSLGNFQPQTYGGGKCDNGPHVADSAGSFSIAVWAWGTLGTDVAGAVSYGYVVAGRTVRGAGTGDGGPN